MIKRFSAIQNIGRFHDCKLGAYQFKERTIIFGNNGNGKSTITAILRSLSTGNNDMLIARKTLGSTKQKYVELAFQTDKGEQPIIFKNKAWTQAPPNSILIFDSKFISENIFDGENISESQKTNLHRVIIGKTGRSFIGEIRDMNERMKKVEGEKKEKNSVYLGSEMKNYFSLEEFVKLQEDKDIDRKIQEKSNEYEYAKQLNKPNELSFKEKKFGNLQLILKKSVSSSHKAAEKAIKNHVLAHWKDREHGYNFLKEGLSLTKDGESSCPYCGQSLASILSLIGSYKDYFDKAYDDLVQEINGAIKVFYAWNYENELTQIKSESKDWVRFFEDSKAHTDLESILSAAQKRIFELKPKFEFECEKKKKDLNYQVDFSSLTGMQSEWGKVKDAVEVFNKVIKAYTAKSAATDPEKLRAGLGRLRSHKKRFNVEWIKLCDEYVALKEEISKIKVERDALVGKLSSHSKDIFDKHQKTINQALEEIGADFKIKDFSEQKDLRRSDAVFCGFELEFYNTDRVPLEGNESQPNFKNTLSQGDKSALAFAFFLSLLNEEDALEKKIVVFDDPISSFDDERRRKTVQRLANLKNKKGDIPLQKIILTHEKNFMIRLCKENHFDDAAYLRIIPDGHIGGRKKSTFDHCDVAEEFLKPEVVKHVEEFKAFLDGNKPMPSDIDMKGRLILENAFQNKYYLELRDEIHQRKSLHSYVEKLHTLAISGYELESRPGWESLFNDLHVPHHSGSTVIKSEKSPGDLKSILSDTLKALKRV